VRRVVRLSSGLAPRPKRDSSSACFRVRVMLSFDRWPEERISELISAKRGGKCDRGRRGDVRGLGKAPKGG